MTWTIKINYLSLESLTITFIYLYGFTYGMQWKAKIMMWVTKIHFLPLSALRSTFKVSTGT